MLVMRYKASMATKSRSAGAEHNQHKGKVSWENCEINSKYADFQTCENIHKSTITPARENIPDHPALRINKLIASSGFCSRRRADEYISRGRVTINGKPVLSRGMLARPEDIIAIDGIPISPQEQKVYLILNKPVQTVCTAHDPQGRTTVLDLLPEHYKSYRLFPVGRLDFFSEGLLLLTNDGTFAHRMMHPSCCVQKTYEVLVRGPATAGILAKMRAGMVLEDGARLAPIEARAIAKEGDTLLVLTLYQGLNREIRRMCACLGLTILRLRRTAQGPLKLNGLKAGKFRSLSSSEMKMLGLKCSSECPQPGQKKGPAGPESRI